MHPHSLCKLNQLIADYLEINYRKEWKGTKKITKDYNSLTLLVETAHFSHSLSGSDLDLVLWSVHCFSSSSQSLKSIRYRIISPSLVRAGPYLRSFLQKVDFEPFSDGVRSQQT
jgi:hypothetical protein